MRFIFVTSILCVAFSQFPCFAQEAKPSPVADPALAKQLGADEQGMHKYVLVILKTGPHRVPDGPARDKVFKGHFANIKRLASAGKLVLAGPFDEQTGWRGMFVFAVDTKEEAEQLVSTDPVIKEGEMVAEYHPLYASAALMAMKEIHEKIAPQ